MSINENVPSTDNVKLSTSLTYKGKIAPVGSVYFVLKTLYGKKLYETAYLVKRSGMPRHIEIGIGIKLKNEFLKNVIALHNTPKKLKAGLKQEIKLLKLLKN